MSEQAFPLYARARELGLLDGGSGLVVAPTATGKSYIGREAIRAALCRGDRSGGPHAYLVPYRALATEVYESFQSALDGTQARVRLLTGDHRSPRRPEDADLVVATYESFAGFIAAVPVRPGVIVADEVHLVADEERGPLAEGLIAEVLAGGRAQALIGLSAVVDNADELADWLGVPLLLGTPRDRTVGLAVRHAFADDLDRALTETLRLLPGGQALVFCSSRARAERAARLLADHLGLASPGLPAPPEDEDDPVLDLLDRGVAYHHAGLPRSVRQYIETLFRCGQLAVVACTPTLAAGVNLPARIAVVRDVFRSAQVRGRHFQVPLPPGEVLNMLGRAGRPGLAGKGVGVVLVERSHRDEIRGLVEDVRAGHGGRVESRLAARFESLMRFVLSVVTGRGEATRDDVAAAFARTLAYHEQPAEVSFGRTLRDDLMEDLPAYERARRGKVTMAAYTLTAEGVDAVADSSGKRYEVQLRITGCSCDCPAGARYYRDQVCKHQALIVHELLFGDGVDPEARSRALYLCGHVFGQVLDIGTRLAEALRLLVQWSLVERVPGGWTATELGKVASVSGFDLLLVHQAAARLRDASIQDAGPAGYREVARWAVGDFHADAAARDRWLAAVDAWLDEIGLHDIRLPTKYRGDFEQGADRLAQVCLLYQNAAGALGNPGLAEAARQAAGALRYGVAPELVPLMALTFPQLRRARARYLYDRGVRDVTDLADADPALLADPRRAPLRYVTDWVEAARQVHRARVASVAGQPGYGQPGPDVAAELDELVARFRLDPAALDPTPAPL